ncbi:hypothetical protein BD408DRAFT_417118 [Parasitella parasitica]|nr:hypothetical protein BD408DRAFT_417118 [Parasitella parasitica]
MSYSKNERFNDLVERRVDKLFGEFFTDCPIGRKSVSGCPAIGNGSKSPDLSSNYATRFFTECPYGKKATTECPYGKGILEKTNKNTDSHFHDLGHAHSGIGKTPEYATEFFTECPYGRRVADQCPYGHEILEKAHKKVLNAHHGHGHGHGHGHASLSGYAEEFFIECPYGKKAASQCPYGQEILNKTHQKTMKAHHHHYGKHGHPDYLEEFFTECPYGKKAANQCSYGHEILERARKSPKSPKSRNSSSERPDYVDEFFLECPYGKKAAEECPYGHDLLEKAGVEVPPLKKHDEDSVKCPFADLASPGEKCPVSGAANNASATTAGKCPVGGVLPQSEKCPISPNYKKPFIPVVDSYETDDDFKFFVELPGVSKGDVKLDIKDKMLILSGQVRTVAEEIKGNVCFAERTLGTFSRSILLHDNVCVDKIQAKLENGVLSITVPKNAPSIKKSITIN